VKQSERDKHVVFELQGFSDGGSTPPASKIKRKFVLSEVEGHAYFDCFRAFENRFWGHAPHGDIQQLGSHTRANPQIPQVVIDVLYAHCPRCPRDLKERGNPIEDCPSTRLDYVIGRGYSKGTVLAIAREESAVQAAFSYPDEAA
jgi:hypothetical protein